MLSLAAALIIARFDFDPVESILLAEKRSYPVAVQTRFDRALAEARTKPIVSAKYPILAKELNRLAEMPTAQLREAARLWEYYPMTDGTPRNRAPFARPFRDEDLTPDKADPWCYLLLKPDWPSVVNGPRALCMSALDRIDSARTLRLLAELVEVVSSPAGDTLVGVDQFGVFGLAYTHPNPDGWRLMTKLAEHGSRVGAEGFQWNFTIHLRHERSKNASAWRALIAEHLQKPDLPPSLHVTFEAILKDAGKTGN